MSEERLKTATSPLLSSAFPLCLGMAFPAHPPAVFCDVGIGGVEGVAVFAMRAVNRRIARAVDVLRKRGRSVQMGRFHAPTMRTSHASFASRIGIVAKVIDRAALRNRANPMLIRPSVSLSDALNTVPCTEFSVTKRADVSLPFKASIFKTLGFSKESNFRISANGALINSVRGPGCQPSTVMSPAPTSSNGRGFSATFYGANVHRTSIPNRLNIGG